MRRKGQDGSVFQKGRRQDEQWLGDKPAYLRFWRDVPGQLNARREVVPLGFCRTRTIAERKASEKLEQLGINSAQRFHEANTRTTFKQQGEAWLKSLANKKRDPVEQTTIDNRRYALDKWIYPFLGSMTLGEVNNRTLKELVEKMSGELAASSIRDYANIVKAVVASAIDDNGEALFPRTWNEEFIDAPIVKNQHQPSATRDGVTAIIAAASGQHKILYALLAGCGPLRVGEALGLEIDKHLSPDFRTLHIRQKAKRGEIQPYLKTKAGEREVDLCSELASMLRDFVGDRKDGLLFHTSTGRQLLQSTILRDSLHPILEKIQHIKGGFNIFRRFRRTYIEKKTDCPDVLRHFWTGHVQKHVSERYIKLLDEREFRLEWAEKIGLGFELPRPNGQLGQLVQLRKVV
jgi:integrase